MEQKNQIKLEGKLEREREQQTLEEEEESSRNIEQAELEV